MPRFFICALFFAAMLLCGCPKPEQLSTQTGIAIGGGGEIPPAATAQREMRRVGPEKPELKWAYNIPPEAEMTQQIHALHNRNIPHVEVGYDGTAYFTACALPAAREELTFLDETRERDLKGNDPDLSVKRGGKIIRIGSLARNAPKEDWLFAVGPDGTFKWVFKAPGGPVGMPMLTSAGDIVIGTYGIHARDFNKSRSTEDDPREHSGGIFIVRPNGELLREIQPDGWLDQIMMGPDDTLICRISDEGDALKELYYRYAAVSLDGEVLWVKPEESFNVIDADHDGMLFVALDDGIYSVDPLTGKPVERYRATDPRASEYGWSEFDRDGALYSIDGLQKATTDLIAGEISIDQANRSVHLVKYDRDNNKLWEVLAGMGVPGMAARPDGRLVMVRILAVYDSMAPYGFRSENKLICLDENGEVDWSYIDQMIGSFWWVTLDDELNTYVIADAIWGMASGVVSLDRDGRKRWELPLSSHPIDINVILGAEGMMYLILNDEVQAYGEAQE